MREDRTVSRKQDHVRCSSRPSCDLCNLRSGPCLQVVEMQELVGAVGNILGTFSGKTWTHLTPLQHARGLLVSPYVLCGVAVGSYMSASILYDPAGFSRHHGSLHPTGWLLT